MGTENERDEVDEWMFRCYGATVNISARLQKIRKNRARIHLVSWSLPTAVLAFVGWLGPQSQVFQKILWIIGGVGVVLSLVLVYDNFSLAADEKKLQNLFDENMKLTLKAQTIQRLKDADFKAEVRGLIEACSALSMREQNEFTWTTEEDRAGLRASLFNFQKLCNVCKKKPLSKELPGAFSESTHCHNCGERLDKNDASTNL